MAAENGLWGAPRIHGELLKLGMTISERTVSRYLRGRPTARSQTWRTFFVNHLGGQILISPVMFADAHEDEIVVDPAPCHFAKLRRSMPRTPPFAGRASSGGVRSSPRPTARVSARITFRTAQKRGRAAAVTRRGTSRCRSGRGVGPAFFRARRTYLATDGGMRPLCPRVRDRLQFGASTRRIESFNVLARPTFSFSPRGVGDGIARRCEYWRTTATPALHLTIHASRSIDSTPLRRVGER
jgi:hypothetical protein